MSSLSSYLRNMLRLVNSRWFAPPTFGKVTPQPRGHKQPTRRVMKSPERLPNVRTRAREFTVAASATGTFNLIPPYPPRVNRSIEVYPSDKRKPAQVHKAFPLRWKNVEYQHTPVLRMGPHQGDRWTGRFVRIEHELGKK